MSAWLQQPTEPYPRNFASISVSSEMIPSTPIFRKSCMLAIRFTVQVMTFRPSFRSASHTSTSINV